MTTSMWRVECLGKIAWHGVSEHPTKEQAMDDLRVVQRGRRDVIVRVREVQQING